MVRPSYAILAVLALAAPLGACNQTTFGEQVTADGRALAEIGERAQEGERLIERGERLVERGNRRIADGEEEVAEGRELIARGEALVRDARLAVSAR